MTTASDLADEMEGLAKGATARPWALTPSDDDKCVWEGDRDKSAADLALIDTLVNRLPEILSALRRVEKPVFAWVIEAPGQHYLAAREIGGLTSFHWTTDHEKALRFWSREQADLTASGVRRLEPALWAFAGTLGEAWPREHGWIARQAITGEA